MIQSFNPIFLIWIPIQNLKMEDLSIPIEAVPNQSQQNQVHKQIGHPVAYNTLLLLIY